MSVTKFSMRRRGADLLTYYQFKVLLMLRDCDNVDDPFQSLEGVHPSTIRSLMERDMIFESPGIDGIKYRITGRGRLMAQKFETPSARERKDMSCCRCHMQPRAFYPSGKSDSYCRTCRAEYEAERRAKRSDQQRVKASDKPCRRCMQRPRHIFSSGRVHSCCYECNAERKRKQQEAYRRRVVEKISDGEIVVCPRCHQRPRHISPNWAYYYCRKCLTQIARAGRLRRILQGHLGSHDERSAGR